MPIKIFQWKRPVSYGSKHKEILGRTFDELAAKILSKEAPIEIEHMLVHKSRRLDADRRPKYVTQYRTYFEYTQEHVQNNVDHIARLTSDINGSIKDRLNYLRTYRSGDVTWDVAKEEIEYAIKEAESQRDFYKLCVRFGPTIRSQIWLIAESTALRTNQWARHITNHLRDNSIKFKVDTSESASDGPLLHVYLEPGAKVGQLLIKVLDKVVTEWVVHPSDEGHLILRIIPVLATRKGFLHVTKYRAKEEMLP